MTHTSPQSAIRPARPKPISVLAVDDDEIVLDVIEEFLMQLGVEQAQIASDGSAGLRALRTMPRAPDFVIVDVYMPDMDGIEFLEQLAQMQYRGGVILVSGSDVEMLQMAKELATASGLNIRATLVKPLHMEDLSYALALAQPGQ